jgi:1-pyrroline-5-carboxylate dehydrogenase
MANAIFNVPEPKNEPNLTYAPGTPERKALKEHLKEMGGREIEIPIIIGGREYKTARLGDCRSPHRHSRVLAKYHQAGEREAKLAVAAAMEAREQWAAMCWHDRAAVFLKAADMLAGQWRQVLNSATMLGQSKTAFQAEIDSACELIDFWRFNVHFMQRIFEQQPLSSPGVWNRMEHRPLEGFVFAVTPFNFTAIAGNLPTAPAIAGNTVVWKPASSAVYSAYHIMRLLEAAGLPPGVINLVPGPGRAVGDPVLASADLAGIHFTGSTPTFQEMWRTIGKNIAGYRTYPRIVGETGGKDFVFAHPSADSEALVTALIRGAFEFQGQKCSAASRAYVPRSIWADAKKRLLETAAEIRVGPVEDFRNFMGAVIDKSAFESIKAYIEYGKSRSDVARLIFGGGCNDSTGYFIEPTIFETTDPHFKLMEEEIFGPVLTVFVYDDQALEEALTICDYTSPYALTGAVFATDRGAIAAISNRLRNAAGNFYVNDKPTGAVVGQQPFGGARASGTNDKAGALINMQRWVSQRTIKETFCPPRQFSYPFMGEE